MGSCGNFMFSELFNVGYCVRAKLITRETENNHSSRTINCFFHTIGDFISNYPVLWIIHITARYYVMLLNIICKLNAICPVRNYASFDYYSMIMFGFVLHAGYILIIVCDIYIFRD